MMPRGRTIMRRGRDESGACSSRANTGPIYAQMPDSDIQAFATSTRRLADLAGSVRVIYVAHFARYAADSYFLAEVADGFERVAAGEVALRQADDGFTGHVREACFERFSIFIPPEREGA
jgi:hypothetical protein